MRPRKWTDAEVQVMSDLYQNSPLHVQQIANRLNRTKYSIYGKARALRIRRASKKLRSRGYGCATLNEFEVI